MKESTERTVRLGLKKKPSKVCNEIEMISAEMVREGWILKDTLVEDTLENIHLFFEREIPEEKPK